VILNLSIWFALHTLFGTVQDHYWFGATIILDRSRKNGFHQQFQRPGLRFVGPVGQGGELIKLRSVVHTDADRRICFVTEVGQTSAPSEISKLHSVFTTDARSRFGAEVNMIDASNSSVQLASDDATASRMTEFPTLLKAISAPLTSSDAASATKKGNTTAAHSTLRND
jgi:hypothetical protein